MNTQQLDLFGQKEQENPLKDKYVCLSGKFHVKQLKDLLLSTQKKGKGR